MLEHNLVLGGMSVCLAVTCWQCIKTNDCKITWLSLLSSPGTPVFLGVNLHTPGRRRTPQARASNENGVGKTGENRRFFKPINCYMSESIEDRHIVPMED